MTFDAKARQKKEQQSILLCYFQMADFLVVLKVIPKLHRTW